MHIFHISVIDMLANELVLICSPCAMLQQVLQNIHQRITDVTETSNKGFQFQLLEAVINWNQILIHITILHVNDRLGSRFTELCASLCVENSKETFI